MSTKSERRAHTDIKIKNLKKLYITLSFGKNNSNKPRRIEYNMENKKSKEQNRSLYITVVVILVALAAVVGVTSAVGKKSSYVSNSDALATDEFLLNEERLPSGVGAEDETDKTADTNEAANTDEAVDANANALPSDTESDTSSDTESDDGAESEPTNTLPEFRSPVAGEVINPHSDTVPVFSVTMNDYRTHMGVDVSASPGEAVCAAADGVVGAIYEDPMMGTCMTVVHSGGAVSTYKGLYSTIPDGIVQGAAVTCGQAIAAVGDTALAEVAEEPHVHYELSIDGVCVDPCLYINFDSVSYEG